MRSRLLLLPALAVIAAFALVACGGGDSDEDQITDVIETTSTTTSEENCTDLQTQAFLEQTNFATGDAALEDCKTAGDESNADSVEVGNIEIDGESATAEATFEGAAFDGQTVVVGLVKEDDQWKLDSLDDFVDFNPEQFGVAFAEQATQGEEPLTQEQADCIAENFANAEAEIVAEAIISGDPKELEPAFTGCL